MADLLKKSQSIDAAKEREVWFYLRDPESNQVIGVNDEPPKVVRFLVKSFECKAVVDYIKGRANARQAITLVPEPKTREEETLEQEEQVRQCLYRAVRDWENVEWDGKELACTAVNMTTIFSEAWILNQLGQFCVWLPNFGGKGRADISEIGAAEKKSEDGLNGDSATLQTSASIN